MRGKIVPKNKAKGVDFCGVDKHYYIIRSDLGCYMRSTKLNFGDDLDIFSLHPACRHADHYAAYKLDLFYVIFGDHYRVVSNLNTDRDAEVHTLHPNCRGGDHYLSAWDYFFIIYQERGVFRRTRNLNKDDDGEEFTLHPNCRDGIYYFGVGNYYYFVRALDKGGIEYVESTNFSSNEITGTFPFHPTVINFLPGGLAITKGPSYGEWICFQTITNESKTLLQDQRRIIKKTGYEKENMSSIEHTWKVYANVPPETGGLSALLVRSQFSLPAEYGGFSVNTEKESWKNVTEHEMILPIALEPQEKLNVWTYQLGLGTTPVLHYRNIRIIRTSEPPSDIPLPPAEN